MILKTKTPTIIRLWRPWFQIEFKTKRVTKEAGIAETKIIQKVCPKIQKITKIKIAKVQMPKMEIRVIIVGLYSAKASSFAVILGSHWSWLLIK